MKRFIICIWFGLCISFLHGATVSFDDMRARIAYDPLGALASLDSLETSSAYSSYQTDYLGIFSKCPQNKMAYEVIMVYHLHMPFFIVIFPCILT